MSHFQDQALARYNVRLSNDDVAGILESIRRNSDKENHGKSFFIHRESKSISHWIVVSNGVGLRVVYNNKKGCLVTALPPQGESYDK